jgi:hypothetical protein
LKKESLDLAAINRRAESFEGTGLVQISPGSEFSLGGKKVSPAAGIG